MKHPTIIIWTAITAFIALFSTLSLHVYSVHAGFEGFAPLASLGDDKVYWEMAKKIQDGNTPDDLPHAYPMILALLFNLCGSSLVLGKLLNSVCYVGTVYYGLVTTNILCQWKGLSKASRRYSITIVSLLLILYPSQLFYSTQLFKDQFLIFCGVASFYYSIKLFQKITVLDFILWSVSFAGLWNLRSYAAISLILGYLSYLVLVWESNLGSKAIVVVIGLTILGIAPNFLGMGFFASNLITPWLDAEKLSSFRQSAYSDAVSSAGISIDYSNPISFLISFLMSFITSLFGPFIWQVRSAVQLFGLPEAVATLLLSLRITFLKFKKKNSFSGSNNCELIPLSCSIASIALITLFSDNAGATSRLRIMAWDLFFIYLSITISTYRYSKRTEYPLRVNTLNLSSDSIT